MRAITIVLAALLWVAAARASAQDVKNLADVAALLPAADRAMVTGLQDAALTDSSGETFHPFNPGDIHRFRIRGIHRSAGTTVALDVAAYSMANAVHLSVDQTMVEKTLVVLGQAVPVGWLTPAGFRITRRSLTGTGMGQLVDVQLDIELNRGGRRFAGSVTYRVDLANSTAAALTAGPAELLQLVVMGQADPHFSYFLEKANPRGAPCWVRFTRNAVVVDLTYPLALGPGASLSLGGNFNQLVKTGRLELTHYTIGIAELAAVPFAELSEIRQSPPVQWLMAHATRGGHVFAEQEASGWMVKVMCGCGRWIHYLVGKRITVLASNIPSEGRD